MWRTGACPMHALKGQMQLRWRLSSPSVALKLRMAHQCIWARWTWSDSVSGPNLGQVDLVGEWIWAEFGPGGPGRRVDLVREWVWEHKSHVTTSGRQVDLGESTSRT